MPLPRSLPFGLLAAGMLAMPAGAGDKLEKDQKKWLESVWAIMLPEEERFYKDLKKDDRAEFQKIFWARRDPDLATPENEFQAEFQKNAAEADKRYKVAGRAGSTTDCGRVFLLLGEANEVKKEPDDEPSGPRDPEIWTYRDRPGMTFKGGQVQIGFDGECSLPQGARLGEQLNQLAEARITQPNLDYRLEAGRLVKLADSAAEAVSGADAAEAAAPGVPARGAAEALHARQRWRHLRRAAGARRGRRPDRGRGRAARSRPRSGSRRRRWTRRASWWRPRWSRTPWPRSRATARSWRRPASP